MVGSGVHGVGNDAASFKELALILDVVEVSTLLRLNFVEKDAVKWIHFAPAWPVLKVMAAGIHTPEIDAAFSVYLFLTYLRFRERSGVPQNAGRLALCANDKCEGVASREGPAFVAAAPKSAKKAHPKRFCPACVRLNVVSAARKRAQRRQS
jgi:hypothetical protein